MLSFLIIPSAMKSKFAIAGQHYFVQEVLFSNTRRLSSASLELSRQAV